jgi:endonuclease IV
MAANDSSKQLSLTGLQELIGGHVKLEQTTPKDRVFQCFLTNSHGHFAESRVTAWTESGIRFGRAGDQSGQLDKSGRDKEGGERIKRIVHASYVTFPWTLVKETHDASIKDIHFASRCANILGMWGLNLHLPKEYHLSAKFEEHVAECFNACEAPCFLLFEIVGSSTRYVSEGKLPSLPIQRMKVCQEVIERVASRMHRENSWGFCFDTAHAFVQGQPLTTADDVERFLADAKGVRISAIHLNGSKYPFRSGRDQHATLMTAFDFIWGNDSSGLKLLLKWIIENRLPTILERAGPLDHYDGEMQQLLELITKK